MARILVIGGGISGLACARGIIDRAPWATVTVLESAARPGGPVCSERTQGFVCEVGPHGFVDGDPSTLALARRVGLGGRVVPADPGTRGRFVMHGGGLRRFPDGPLRFLTSDLLSVWGRARVFMELLRRPPHWHRDDSVGAWARRRLGNELAERLVDPLVCGVSGGDMDRLSLTASAPQLAAMIRSMRPIRSQRMGRAASARASQPASGPAPRRLVSFAGGTGELVTALARSLGPVVECDSPVTALVRRETAPRGRPAFRVVVGGARPRELTAYVVLVAVPAPDARALLGPLDPDLGGALGAIPYLQAAVLALGFRREDLGDLPGFGYLVPRTEGGTVLGVHFSSNMFPGARAARGTVLVQAIMGGSRHPAICDQPDARLYDELCAQLRATAGMRGLPLLRRIYRHVPGLPQYQVGHHRLVARVAAAETRLPGLFVTGNALHGIGINACTTDAERVGAGVLRHLGMTESREKRRAPGDDHPSACQ